jgi:hypothetical protein
MHGVNGHDPERARRALHTIDAGTDRETWVRAGMAAKAAGLGFDDFHDWSSSAGNYAGEADCRAVWKSFREDRGIGAGTLFALARESGWHDESSRQARQKATQGAPQPDRRRKPAFDVQNAWDACEPATVAQPYIARKQGLADGLRVYRGPLTIAGQALDGALVVPAYALDGKLMTLQFIPPEGKKLNAPGRPVAGVFVVGRIPHGGEGATLYVCEGIGQAWACHQAAGGAAVVSFGAGRMEQVAREFRNRYPAAGLVLVADAGKEQHCARIAKETGCAWVEMPEGSPGNFDANDCALRDGLDALASLLAAPKEPPQRFRLLTAAELAALPPLDYRIKRVLPKFGLAAIYGASGTGKTFLILDAVMSAADGRPWFGYRTKPCPVVYVGLEGAAGLAQRVRAYRAVRGADAGRQVRFITAPLSILESGDLQELAAAIRAQQADAGIVVIDTLNQAAPGADENSSEDMGRIIAGAKALQADIGGLVVLVHHTGKDATRGLRGHSSLFAALDAAVEVARDGDRREWRVAKAKDGEDGGVHPFRLTVVELGEDADGEPITSCIVEPDEPTEEAFRRVLPPKSGNQRIVWDGLSEMFKAAGLRVPEGAPAELPPNRPAVCLDDAVEKLRTRLPVEAKRQTERTRQAITGLVSRGLVTLREGFLWLP